MSAGSYGPWQQLSLFTNESGEVPRLPGWMLISGPSVNTSWHVVDRSNPDRSVTTVCGVVGRVVQSNASVITPCGACTAAEPAS